MEIDEELETLEKEMAEIQKEIVELIRQHNYIKAKEKQNHLNKTHEMWKKKLKQLFDTINKPPYYKS